MRYEKPNMELVRFHTEEILTASGANLMDATVNSGSENWDNNWNAQLNENPSNLTEA